MSFSNILGSIRGMASSTARIGGDKVFFPRILLTLVRTPTLPPTQAAFNIPPSMNKLDVVSYLRAVYNLPVTDVRTVNFDGKVRRLRGSRHRVRAPARKRAIVTMERPFHWPAEPAPSEMQREGMDVLMRQTRSLAKRIAAKRGSLEHRGWLMPGQTSRRQKPELRASWVAEEAQLRGFEGPAHT